MRMQRRLPQSAFTRIATRPCIAAWVNRWRVTSEERGVSSRCHLIQADLFTNNNPALTTSGWWCQREVAQFGNRRTYNCRVIGRQSPSKRSLCVTHFNRQSGRKARFVVQVQGEHRGCDVAIDKEYPGDEVLRSFPDELNFIGERD